MCDKTVVLCRCEDITQEKVRECIQNGCHTIDEIKRVSRAGMGPCQGRTCQMLIAQELASYYHIPLEEVLIPTSRPPVKPVSMGILAKAFQEGGDSR